VNQAIGEALVSYLTESLLESPKPAPTPAPAEAGAALDVTFLSALFEEMTRALATPATYVFH
jgi:hypothetical protein